MAGEQQQASEPGIRSIVRSTGMVKTLDGGMNIKFIVVVNNGEYFVLYDYGVPHAIARFVGHGPNAGYQFIYSEWAVESATSFRVVKAFYREICGRVQHSFEQMSVRRKSVGPFNKLCDTRWTGVEPRGWGKKSADEFNKTLMGLNNIDYYYPEWGAVLRMLDTEVRGATVVLD